MIWFNEENLTEWAYLYCKDINDDPNVRKHITDEFWVYLYCKDINNNPEVRKRIINKKI